MLSSGARAWLGFWIGAWAGAVLEALLAIAVDTSYTADDLVGGYKLKARAILFGAAAVAAVCGFIGARVATPRTAPDVPLKKPFD